MSSFVSPPASLRVVRATPGSDTAGASTETCFSPVAAGASYALSFRYRFPSVPAMFVSATVNWFADPCLATFLGSSVVGGFGQTVGDNTWRLAAGTVTAPAGAVGAFLRLSLRCTVFPCPVGAFANFDDVVFEAGIAASVSFRGLSAVRMGHGVLVRWRAAADIETLGFNVYREVKGTRVRVNARLIRASARGLYSFLDRKAPRGKHARYWIQVVALDGSRQWHGPARLR
jgi:hypothetical protein